MTSAYNVIFVLFGMCPSHQLYVLDVYDDNFGADERRTNEYYLAEAVRNDCKSNPEVAKVGEGRVEEEEVGEEEEEGRRKKRRAGGGGGGRG